MPKWLNVCAFLGIHLGKMIPTAEGAKMDTNAVQSSRLRPPLSALDLNKDLLALDLKIL